MARRGVQFILIKCARCNRADCLKRIKKIHYNLTLAPRGKRKPNVLRRGLDWAGQPDSSKPAPMSARDSVQSINYALRASGSTFPAASLEWNFGRTSRDRIRTDSSLCCCTAVVFIFVLLLLWSVACGRVWGWRVLRIKQTQPLVSIKRPRIVLVQMCRLRELRSNELGKDFHYCATGENPACFRWVGRRCEKLCWIRNEKRFPPHKCTSEYEGMEDEVGADRDDDDVFVFV